VGVPEDIVFLRAQLREPLDQWVQLAIVFPGMSLPGHSSYAHRIKNLHRQLNGTSHVALRGSFIRVRLCEEDVHSILHLASDRLLGPPTNFNSLKHCAFLQQPLQQQR
jgi:hypothetical protein